MPGSIVLPDEQTRQLWEEAKRKGWRVPAIGVPPELDPDAPGDGAWAAWHTFRPEPPEMRSYLRVNAWGGLRPLSAYRAGTILHGGGPLQTATVVDEEPFRLEVVQEGPFGSRWYVVPPSGGPGLYPLEARVRAEAAAAWFREVWGTGNTSAAGHRTSLLGQYGPRPDDWEYR